MDKISLFLFNIFINSLFSFFTAVFLVEGIILLFRIPQNRLASILRMIPILKLPFDLYLYDFSSWSYIHGVNPLSCEEGTRTFSVVFGFLKQVTDWFSLPIHSSIQFTLPGNMTFTIADIIGYSLGFALLHLFSLVFLVISAALLFTKMVRYYKSIKFLRLLTPISESLKATTDNLILNIHLKKRPIQILTSSHFESSPFVAGLISHCIYIPKSLYKLLSQQEHEAILAHELEHIRHKDNFVRLCLDVITSIFWWIPAKGLRSRIEEGQEMGCDLQCQRYRVQPIDLASAIVKSMRYSINMPTYCLTEHFTKQPISKRLDILLKPTSFRCKKIQYVFFAFAFGIAFFMAFLGRFWIF